MYMQLFVDPNHFSGELQGSAPLAAQFDVLQRGGEMFSTLSGLLMCVNLREFYIEYALAVRLLSSG
jgi:hypothetical protein